MAQFQPLESMYINDTFNVFMNTRVKRSNSVSMKKSGNQL